MSEWWLGTIVAIWCVALAGSEGIDEDHPVMALGLLVVWLAVFAFQLTSHAAWEAGASFAGFVVATFINSELRRSHGDGRG